VPALWIRTSPTSGRAVYTVRLAAGPRGAVRARRVTIGDTTLVTLTEARKRALQLMAQHSAVPLPPAVRRGTLRVGEALDAWMEQLQRKPKTLADYQLLIDGRIKPALGLRTVVSLTRREVTAWHAGMAERPVAANRALAVLSSCCTWCLADERVPPTWVHPCRYVQAFPEQHIVRALNADEFGRLGAALTALSTVGLLPSPHRRRTPATGPKATRRPKAADLPRQGDPVSVAALLFLLFTGLRKREVLCIQWDDVALDDGRVRLPDSKTGARWVPLAESAVAVLRTLQPLVEGSPWVFPSPVRDGALRSVRRTWDTVRSAAALERFRLHDLRHTFASMLAAQGESLVMIGHLLGHKRVQTTAKYAHLVDEAQRTAATSAVDAIRASLGAASETGTPFPAGTVAFYVRHSPTKTGTGHRARARGRN
jgi:integrase